MEGPPLHLGVFYFLQRKTNKENQRMRSRCVWTSVFATNLSYQGYPTQGSISPDLPRSVCFVLINIINSKSFYSFYDSTVFNKIFNKIHQACTEVQISLNMPYFHEVDSMPQPISNLVALHGLNTLESRVNS